MMAVDIPSLIVKSGGEIYGKVRLQKMVYLLDQLGMKSGFSFEYHHYGPYSEELSDQVHDDIVFQRIKDVTKHRASDGVPYVVFKAEQAGDGAKPTAHLASDTLSRAISEFSGTSATILELAATIHWLAEVEGIQDWKTELVKRKGAKTANGRSDKAFSLLSKLKLPPAA